MSTAKSPQLQNGFCIFIDTFFQGAVPILSDGDGKFVIFETELEAQREIADHQLIRLQQFIEGERDFEDAMTVEEFVVPVTVHPDGVIVDECGNSFGPRVDGCDGAAA